MPRSALIIYNPTSSGAVQPDLWLGSVVHRLCDEGDYAVTVLPIKSAMAPEDIFARAGSDVDLLVAAGGDGTIRFVLEACARAKSPVPVGLLPLGTGNQLARNLSIYEENILGDPLEEALSVILRGQVFALDLGVMNGKYFCVAAGVGPLSDAILMPEQQDKVNWKMLAYASSMIQTFALPPVIFRIHIADAPDGKESFDVSASGIFVTNVADLGVGTLSDTAQLNDGLLDLCVLNPMEFNDYLSLGFRFGGGFVGGQANYYIRKVTALDIEVLPIRSRLSKLQKMGQKFRAMIKGTEEAPRPLVRQVTAMIDGDASGTTPMHIEVVPRAVNVLVPLTVQTRGTQAMESKLSILPPTS